MKTTLELVEEIRARYSLRSDSAVAKKLGLTRSAISAVRRQNTAFDESTAIRAAALLSYPIEDVLLWMQTERAKDPVARDAWKRVMNSMKNVAAVVVIAIAIALPTPSPASQVAEISATSSPMYIMSTRRRRFSRRLRTIFSFMRTRMLAYLLPIALAACGSKETADNHGLGYNFDAQSTSGLRVRYADDRTPRIDQLETIYEQVASCMGITALPTGPLLIFAPGVLAQDMVPGIGFLDSMTYEIEANLMFTQPGGDFTIRHELVHHLLDATGFPRDRNQAHDSPLFNSCS